MFLILYVRTDIISDLIQFLYQIIWKGIHAIIGMTPGTQNFTFPLLVCGLHSVLSLVYDWNGVRVQLAILYCLLPSLLCKFYCVYCILLFLQSAFYSLHSAVYNLYSKVCIIQWTFYNLQNTFYSVHYTVRIVQHAFYSMHSTLCIL